MGKKKWTEEKIIKELQKFYKKHGRLTRKLLEDNNYGLLLACYRYLDSVDNAFKKAGLPVNHIYENNKWSEEKIIKELQGFYKKHGKVTQRLLRDYKRYDIFNACYYYFNSLNKASILAGLPIDQKREKKWSKEKVIEELKILERRGIQMTYNNLQKKYPAIHSACSKQFGSFNRAKLASNIPINQKIMAHPLIKRAKKLSPSLGYVIGVILGDGHIGKRGQIQLSTIDKDFVKYYMRQFKKWSGLNYHISLIKGKEMNICGRRYHQKDYFRADICAINYGNFLKNKLGLVNHGRSWQPTKLDWILDTPIWFKKMVFKGFFDSEGCISLRCFRLYNNNLELLKIMKQLGKDFGIKNGKIIREKREDVIYILYYTSIPNILTLYDEIGVTIKRKINPLLPKIKAWKEKNKLYEIVMELRKKGLGSINIAKQMNTMGFNISEGSIRCWVYGNKVPYSATLHIKPKN